MILCDWISDSNVVNKNTFKKIRRDKESFRYLDLTGS